MEEEKIKILKGEMLVSFLTGGGMLLFSLAGFFFKGYENGALYLGAIAFLGFYLLYKGYSKKKEADLVKAPNDEEEEAE